VLRPIVAALSAVMPLACPAARAAEQKGGMPQLDFANPLTVSQVVWGAIIFFVLYLMLRDWGLPQIERVLEQRAGTIAADLEAAQQFRAEATATAIELREIERKARSDAQAEIARADDQARQQAARRSSAMDERLEAQIAAAEVRIATARGVALGALREVANETAAALVVRLTGQPPPPQAVERAVASLLAATGRG
jgi:F-type H+-transporting ATPase subunit b